MVATVEQDLAQMDEAACNEELSMVAPPAQ